jgi:hypothetical protein
MKKWCVNQSVGRVHQLNTIATFTHRWVVSMTVLASSFSSSVIGGGFDGRGTHRLKERNREDLFLSFRKRRICGSKISGPSIH